MTTYPETTIQYWTERAEQCFAIARELDRGTTRHRATYRKVAKAYTLAGNHWRKAATFAVSDDPISRDMVDDHARDGARFEARAHQQRHDLDGTPVPAEAPAYPAEQQDETNMNLRDLVTRAATGHAIEPSIPLDSAARLYAEVARDLDEGNFGSATDDAGNLPVEVESADEDTATLTVHGLRYVVELGIGAAADTVAALCEAGGCSNSPLGRTRLTRVCDEHLSENTLTARAFGIPADEIRERRLTAWEQEITETTDRLTRRDMYHLKRIREGR